MNTIDNVTTAGKEFKKGQVVMHFACWDGKGVFTFRRAIVKSCGMQKMTLEDAVTGKMMGCNFRPNSSNAVTRVWQGKESVGIYSDCTMADMSDEEAVAIALQLGARKLKNLNDHYDVCLAGGHGEAYNNSIRRDKDLLPKEPSAFEYNAKSAELAAELAAKYAK